MSYHAVRLLLLALAVCISTATPLPGQRISGELVDEGSGAPIDGGMILLLDDAGDRVAGTLSDSRGRFVLRPPDLGEYTLRAERVGYRTVHSPPLMVETGQDIEIRLQTIIQPIELEGVVVRAGSRCAIRPEEGAAAYRVWEEARKALASTAWGLAEGKHLFRTRHYRRDLDSRGRRVLREQEETRHIFDDRPFRSTPADELAEQGFLRIVDRQITYHVPDAAVLLSEPFLDGHCFGVRRGGREHAGLVGLTFEPVRGHPVPGIRGTLWLDLETAELRFVEYRYTHATPHRFINRVNGRVEFERLPSGAWIMRRWLLRLPRLGPVNRVVGLSEEGGEVIEVIEDIGGGSAYDATATARAFLEALDARNWRAAASAVHPATLEQFHEFELAWARSEEKTAEINAKISEETGTHFPGPLERLGIGSAAELEALSPEELLARSAEATFLEEVESHGVRPEDLRLRRQLLGCDLEGPTVAHCRYRTEIQVRGEEPRAADMWVDGGARPAMADDLPITLERTPGGWRVRQADLSGTGMSLIYIPDSVRAHLDFL